MLSKNLHKTLLFALSVSIFNMNFGSAPVQVPVNILPYIGQAQAAIANNDAYGLQSALIRAAQLNPEVTLALIESSNSQIAYSKIVRAFGGDKTNTIYMNVAETITPINAERIIYQLSGNVLKALEAGDANALTTALAALNEVNADVVKSLFQNGEELSYENLFSAKFDIPTMTNILRVAGMSDIDVANYLSSNYTAVTAQYSTGSGVGAFAGNDDASNLYQAILTVRSNVNDLAVLTGKINTSLDSILNLQKQLADIDPKSNEAQEIQAQIASEKQNIDDLYDAADVVGVTIPVEA